MKATFIDFIKENPSCSKFEGNPTAIELFELLSTDESIIAMIDTSDAGYPALAARVETIKKFYDGLKNPSIDMTDDFTRKAVGRMVKTILKPFGYEISSQKNLPKYAKGYYFISASCYHKTGPASMNVIKNIEDI